VNDDDVLRQALHAPTEPISSYRVLQDLRPTMRRARNRRRATVGATAALLLAGGGAGVLALTSAPVSPTVRTTYYGDENGAIVSTLPQVSEPRHVSDADTPGEQEAVPTTAAAPIPIQPPASAPASEDQPEAPEAPETTAKPGSPGATPPSDELPPTTPATTAAPAPVAPPQPAGRSSQVLTSACGDVVVEIDEGTVRITSIAPLPGYTSQVSTDGPESVEMKFLGTGDGCEIHAELESTGLDVETQQSDHAD
jgi:hypothetical protein